MNGTDPSGLPAQPGDPALFAPLTSGEQEILYAHLNSGWSKQSAVYPLLSEPWQETSGVLDDLLAARRAAREARAAARAQAELSEPEPEAGP